jgi:actin-like ATPase involved in cell morphogenesis
MTIAIDFGTERTKLAYIDSGHPKLMYLGAGGLAHIPTLFYMGSDGKRLLGDDAAEMLLEDPAGVITVLKRKMHDPYVRANRQRVAPIDLISAMLKALKERAQRQLPVFSGRDLDAVTLTMPALFGPSDRNLMEQAGRAAGFQTVDFVAEPVAAARAWASTTGGSADTVVVFDCGGGTIDWACLHRDGEDFVLVPECPPGGNTRVGGHDVDRDILDHILDRADSQEVLGEVESHANFYLSEARKMKETYCRSGVLRPFRVNEHKVEVTPSEMDRLMRGRFMEQATQDLATFVSDVREKLNVASPTVLLVGGSSHVKGLEDLVAERCGVPIARWDQAEYAIVLGALGVAKDVKSELAEVAVEVTHGKSVKQGTAEKRGDGGADSDTSQAGGVTGIDDQKVATVTHSTKETKPEPKTMDRDKLISFAQKIKQAGASWYVVPDIPKSKCTNALLSYARKRSKKDVIALFDATFWGGARSGYLVMVDGIIQSREGKGPLFTPWNFIDSFECHPSWLGGRIILRRKGISESPELEMGLDHEINWAMIENGFDELLNNIAKCFPEASQDTFGAPISVSSISAGSEKLVLILGQEGHGRRTLCTAMMRHSSQRDTAVGDRHYVFSVPLGSPMRLSIPAGQTATAIIVLEAPSGPRPQTRDYIKQCKRLGITIALVFISKCDLMTNEPDLIDLVDMEIRDLLSHYGYHGDDIPVIRNNVAKEKSGQEAIEILNVLRLVID